MNIEQIAKSEPVFNFEQYFLGHTRASGWFCDRFGNVRKHFVGDFVGSLEGGKFVLDETLAYSDGINEKRMWFVTIDAAGNFSAEGESLHGGAKGRIVGNTLNFKYTMSIEVAGGKKWRLSMDDWMVYQPDGSLHNITRVLKWGFLIGTVSTQYSKVNRNAVATDEQGSANDENANMLSGDHRNVDGSMSAMMWTKLGR